jgi:[acyl-carrier-protein] S-malonyltransferase
MSSIAFVFPGQGSQGVGMGSALASASPAAAAVFAAADAALGESISRLAWEGPAETLNLTEHAQPALLATSIAYLAALRERWAARQADGGPPAPQPVFAAGHSMGQYSAFVASGALSLEDALRLVRERGRLMQASGAGREGRMAALIGLDDARLPELVAGASQFGVFGVANRNAPGQVVVSGERAAVEAALELARKLGARRTIELPVSVAAHSPLMAEAAEQMAATLAGVPFHDPHPAGLANADARPIRTAAAARAELVEHLTTGVDWVRAIETMAAAGVTEFIEIGPGRVLTGLISRIAPSATAFATDAQNATDGLAVP